MPKWKIKDLFWVSPASEGSEPAGTALDVDVVLDESTRAPQVDQVLSMLRDVDGVVGSIAIANAGDVIGSDLPRMFDGAAMEGLAMRLSQLRAALASADKPLKTAAFRYENHALHISQLSCGLIGVLAELRTHEPALEMAARLVGQRLEATIERASRV